MKKRVVLIVAAMCASSGALAADMSQTINPLNEATKIMDRCAAIAARISSTPVPQGHGEARAAELFNQSVAKAQPVAAAAPGKAPPPPEMKKIAPEQTAFMTKIRAERDQLEACGKEYVKVNKPADALLAKTGEALEKEQAKTATEDHKKLGAAMMAYSKSEENLAAAITALSKDKVHEAYLGRVVDMYFLRK